MRPTERGVGTCQSCGCQYSVKPEQLEIEVPDSPLKLEMAPSEQKNQKACTEMILKRLNGAKSPAFLLDMDAIRFGVPGQIMEVAERFQMKVATLNCAKGAVPESSPQFVGIYAGMASSPVTREAIEGSDCLLAVGYRRVETTVGFFTDKLPARSASHPPYRRRVSPDDRARDLDRDAA